MNDNVKTKLQFGLRSTIRRFLVIFLLLAVIIGGILAWVYDREVRNDRAVTEYHEIHSLGDRADMIKKKFQSILADLMYLSERNDLLEMIEGGEADRQEALAGDYRLFSAKRGMYDQIRFLDKTGMEVVRVNFNNGSPSIVPVELLQSKAKRYYFEDTIALERGEVFVSPFDLNIEQGEIEQPLKPMIRFGTPVFDRYGQKRGIVVLNYLGANLINDLKSVADEHGQFILLNSDGFWLAGLAPQDEWAFMFEDKGDRAFGNDFPEAWQRMSASESGQFYNANGMFTYDTVYPLLGSMESSSGASEAITPSTHQMVANQYYWKLISYTSPGILNTVTRAILGRFLLLYAGILAVAAGSSGAIAWTGARRKQAEEALRENEERLSGFMGSATDGFLLFDSELNLVEVNKTALDTWGASREDMVGKNITELSPAIKESGRYDEYMKVMQTGQPFSEEDVATDGRFGETHFSVKAFKAGEGLGLIVTDITEHRKMEKGLIESEEKLKRYLENSPDIICVVGFKGTILYVNKTTERLIGYSREELVGKGFRAFPLLAPENESKPAQWERRGGGEKPTSPDEFELVRKDGTRIWVEITTFPMGEGEQVEVIAIGRDITERKQAEEEKQRMEQQLLLSGRLAAVGELAAGVAHELNNPLAAVQGFAQFLASREDLDETMRSDVETIYKEAKRASRITANLLAFARKHEPEKGLISINGVLEKSVELHEYRMRVNNVVIAAELAPDLPFTMADFYQLQQVFANLITNAEQAMTEANGKGRLVIHTQKVGDTIQITFTDDGPGIPEEDLKRIFDPFFTTKDVGKGTGLGLSICYGIVQEHGGQLSATSKRGKGATFVVELPIVSEDQPASDETGLTKARSEQS
ncbi:MAG: PAS domain S-box protein [Dehalococcoidia bacterium]